MGTSYAHKRQFLIGNKSKQINKDWESVKIAKNLYLSYCPGLLAGKAKDLDGEDWYLLGMAIQTDKEKGDPLTEIGNSLTDNVKELYKSWTGRWVLVGNNGIHPDCCGLLGCFYTKINEDRWISSSLAILQEIRGLSPRPETLRHAFGIEWYPLPLSRFEGVYKLLPSQMLDLKTFYPKQRALPKPIKGLSYDEILEKIAEKLKFSLLNVSNSGKRIFVALTGGYDSRVVLAATRYAGIKVETFTRGGKETSYSDIIMPYKLSKASGCHHRVIKNSRFSKEKEALYDYHIAGNISHVTRKRFSCGQYDSFTKDDLILNGSIFEVARCLYWKYMDSNLNAETIIKSKKGLVYSPKSFNVLALTEWVKWVRQTPTEGLDWRDRFYLEQRVAGWLSSIQQALDLTESERFYIANCHDIISLLLSVPVEKRRTSEHCIDLINKMFPPLLQYPFNPPDPPLIRLQKKVIRISRMSLSEVYKRFKKSYYLMESKLSVVKP